MDDPTLVAAVGRFDALYKVLGPVAARRMTLHRLRAVLHITDAAVAGTPLTAIELSRKTDLMPDDIRPVVQVMSRRGWITVQPDPSDRRHKRLVLGPKGKEFAAKVVEALGKKEERE